jgi:hypothetical protein
MNKSIKIIKHSQRTIPYETQRFSAVTAKTENQVRREIAQTVTSWIEERRAVESAQKTGLESSTPGTLP